MISMDESTIHLLSTFLDQGGCVISAGKLPYLKEGSKDPQVAALMDRIIKAGKSRHILMRHLVSLGVQKIQIKNTRKCFDDNNCYEVAETSDIHCHHRVLGEIHVFYLVNHSQNSSYMTSISLFEKGEVLLYNAETGGVKTASCTHYQNKTMIELDFEPMQSYILFFVKKIDFKSEKPLRKQRILLPHGMWTIDAIELNALTLDYCRYSIDNGRWQGPIPVIKLMDLLLEMKRNCDIALKYTFEINTSPQFKEFYLIVEEAEKSEIYINGYPVSRKIIGWWKDRAFNKIDIRSEIKEGINEVIIKKHFFQNQRVYDVLYGENVHESELNRLSYDTELESIYVVGDFGVISRGAFWEGDRGSLFTNGPFMITKQPKQVETGDITKQGFCFYSGSVKLSSSVLIKKQEDMRIILDIGKIDAVLAKLFINGNPVKSILWAPFEVDITEYVVNGRNEITLQLYGSNRNLFGPHHHIDGELYRVGPMSFSGKRSWVDGDRNETSLWSDTYCFVKFGLQS